MSKNGGPASLNVHLTSTPNTTHAVTNYVWDFDGSGSDDLTCYSHSNVLASYQQTGLYLTKVAVTDTAGNRYLDIAIVNVVDKVEIDSLLQEQWQRMKTALIANDVQTAISYFAPQSQGRYSAIFTTLGNNLITMAQGMQNINMVYFREGVAKYRIRRTESAGEITYYIYFVQDESGQWKIMEF